MQTQTDTAATRSTPSTAAQPQVVTRASVQLAILKAVAVVSVVAVGIYLDAQSLSTFAAQ